MADKIRIGYFLEDRGHEIFLKALVAKIAQSKGLARGDWIDDVRASTEGNQFRHTKISFEISLVRGQVCLLIFLLWHQMEIAKDMVKKRGN